VIARELWRRLRANAPLVGLPLQELPRRPELAPIADDAISGTAAALFLHGVLRPRS
jgi:hypothetical protein